MWAETEKKIEKEKRKREEEEGRIQTTQYCTISIDSANTQLFHMFEKSQKLGKIEKTLFPRPEKMGDARMHDG